MFNVQPIRPGTFNIGAIASQVRALLEEEGRIDKRLMETTTENWDEPPTFETTITIGRDGVADTHPTGANAKKWYYLQFGTSVRYARMSKDWQSHTAPGTLRSGPGAGRVIQRGARAGAQPGIQARMWIQVIVKMRQRPFAARAQAVLGNVQATIKGYNTYKGP